MRTRLFHFIYVSAAALALCCACAKEIEPSGILDGPQPLVFTAGQADPTPGTRAAADGIWDGDGSEFVAIQVGTEVKKYKVTSTFGTLEPYDSDNSFYRTDKSDITITAWYPYSSSQPSQPDIRTDQSTKANREASNLMKASATAVFGKATALTFSHQTAYLKLYLTGEDNKALTAGATVKFIGNTSSTWITAYNEGNGYYSALVAPRTISKNANFLQVTTSVGTYKASAPSAITLEKGKIYNFNYDLKRSLTSKATVTLSGSEFEYSGAVQKPTVTVKYNGTALTQGTDYTLSWSDSNSSALGTYTVTVTGKGAYIGEVKKTYSIVTIPYVTFSAASAQTFTMTLPTEEETAKKIKTGSFECSVNGGDWKPVTSGGTVDFGGSIGDLRLKGTSTYGTSCTTSTAAANNAKCSTIAFSNEDVPVTVSGDLRTLIGGKGYKTTYIHFARFSRLFYDCEALTYASELRLAESQTTYCYYSTFSGCSNLKDAPELPATTLKKAYYQDTFRGCKSLTTAPKLPATTLAESCYFEMFAVCYALTTAPELPAKTLAKGCYTYMFRYCEALTSAPELAATTLAEECYNGMFADCDAFKNAPKLPASTLAEGCYTSMFSNCKSLTTAPELPASTLAKNCYNRMFKGCTKLNSVKIKATDISASGALTDWLPAFTTTSTKRTIYKSKQLTGLPDGSTSGVPSGWVTEDYYDL